MELSKRLQAVADLVTAGYKMADIGTDHAYIPISLISEERIPGAVAMDVNEGPLARARIHVREHHMEDKIEMRLSDGFSALKPGEVQSAVIAGMGGALMIRILKEGAEKVSSLDECILQPQSEIEKVRAFLLEEGFLFIREDMVEEDGKYYPMMKVSPPAADGQDARDKWNETQLRYGKYLLQDKHPVLRQYLEREICIKKQILTGLRGQNSARILDRKKELEKELEHAEKGLMYYAV